MAEPTERDREMASDRRRGLSAGQMIDQKGFIRRIPDLPSEQTFTAADVATAREEGAAKAIREAAFIAECQGPTKISELIRNLIPKKPK